MNQQFLKDHVLDLEVAAALVMGAIAHFYFAFGWLVSVLLGLSAFILIPLLVLCWFYVRAILFVGRSMEHQYPSGWRQTLSWKIGFRRAQAGRAYKCPRWADEQVFALAFLQGKGVEITNPYDPN
jgi:hypothetical protein